MTDVVLDASVAALALVEVTPIAREVRRRLAATITHAPHLVDAEVGSVLRRRVAAGGMSSDQARGALHTLNHLVVQRYPHPVLAAQAWQLRENITYYDALYVALATRLGLPLLTADQRLARAPSLPCAVEVIS